MGLADLPIVAALLPLTALIALFSGAETALFGMTYHDRMRLRKSSPRAAARAEAMLANPGGLLITILIAHNTLTVLFWILTSFLLLRATNVGVGVVIKVVSMFALIVLADVAPKVLADAARLTACRAIVRPLYAFYRVLGPVRVAVQRLVIAPLSRLVTSGSDAAEGLSVAELSTLVKLGTSQGVIDRGEQELLAQVLKLGEIRVREVMTPRVSLTWVNVTDTPAKVRETVARTGHTKIPVLDSKTDEVVGLFNVKRFVASANPNARPMEFVDRARFVPDTARLDKLLEHFRSTHSQNAVCVDERGAVVGLVRIEDVVQCVVTELSAGVEDDAGELAAHDVQMVGLGEWLVPGRLSVLDWADMFGAETDPRVTTVAGLVQAKLQRIPIPGDRVRLGSLELRVEAVRKNAVERVRVKIVERPPDDPEHPAASGVGADAEGGA